MVPVRSYNKCFFDPVAAPAKPCKTHKNALNPITTSLEPINVQFFSGLPLLFRCSLAISTFQDFQTFFRNIHIIMYIYKIMYIYIIYIYIYMSAVKISIYVQQLLGTNLYISIHISLLFSTKLCTSHDFCLESYIMSLFLTDFSLEIWKP